MKVETPKPPEAAVQEFKKNSFIIRQDYLKTACHFLDDASLGLVFRNIKEFIINPAHEAQLPPLVAMNYYQLVEGIKQENEKYYKILEKRKASYYSMKQRAAQFGKNNLDKTDQTEKNEKLKSSLRIGMESIKDSNIDREGNGTDSTATDSTATVRNGSQDANASVSYKNYNIKNKDFFNKEYTRRYLIEKKIFFTLEGFEKFFDFNCELNWPYKAETAARRWFAKNPADEMKENKKIKKAPQQPGTPRDLLGTRRAVWANLSNLTTSLDFMTLLRDVQVVAVEPTMEGEHRVRFSTKGKPQAEIIIQNHIQKIKEAWEMTTKRKIVYYEFCFPRDGEIQFIMSTPDNLKKHCLREEPAKPAEAEPAN